jgi:hypothetical protein
LRGGNEDLSGQQREQKRSVGPLEGKAAAKSQEIRLPCGSPWRTASLPGSSRGRPGPARCPAKRPAWRASAENHPAQGAAAQIPRT